MLNEPLPGQAKQEPSQAQAEIEGESFMNFMTEFQAHKAGA